MWFDFSRFFKMYLRILFKKHKNNDKNEMKRNKRLWLDGER